MTAMPMWREQLTPHAEATFVLSESTFLHGLEKCTVINSAIPFTRDIKQLLADGCFPSAVSTVWKQRFEDKMLQSYYPDPSDSFLFCVSQLNVHFLGVFSSCPDYPEKHSILFFIAKPVEDVVYTRFEWQNSAWSRCSGLRTWQCTENQTEK